MFFRSRPAPPAASHSVPLPPDAHRPRSSSHAPPTARSTSHSHTHPHANTSSSSSLFPLPNSPLIRRGSSASNHTSSPTSQNQSTPQLLHRSSTSTGPFTSFTSSSPSLSPAPPMQQQQLLLNSSFSLSTSSSSSSHTSSQLHSSAPPSHYSYHHFSQKMKDPLASTLVKRLKSIVTSITSRAPPANDQLAGTSREIHSQLHALTSQLPQHPLFARTSREELVNAVESMEKFVLSKLHTTLYYPSNPASPLLPRSRAFYAKSRALSWLHGRHLELPEGKQEAAVWREAGMELRRMVEYKAPKDKLVCLLNACHIIHHTLLSRPASAAGESEVEVGADDIFPAFIFTLVHAHPRHFLLDLRWVSVGRYPEGMRGECEYWVTMAESAIVFIERMNEQSLRVEKEGEFDSEMNKARARREEERRRRKEASSGSDRHSGASATGGVGGSGSKVEEEKRVVEDDDPSGGRSDSDRESDVGAAGSTARLSAASNSSLGADDSASARRLTLNTDDDLNSSTASSSSHFSAYTPSTLSPESSPLSSTTPLPSPLLIPSSAKGAAGVSLLCGEEVLPPSSGVVLSGLSLSYVGAEACELGATDVVRLLEEYKEMAAIIRMWSAKGAS